MAPQSVSRQGSRDRPRPAPISAPSERQFKQNDNIEMGSFSPIELPKSPVIPQPVVDHLEKAEQAALMKEQNVQNKQNDNDNSSNMEIEDINVDVNDLMQNMHSGPIATPPPADDNVVVVGNNSNNNSNISNNNKNSNISNDDNNNPMNHNQNDNFMYDEALVRISEMGFEPNDAVRTLLIRHKGQVNTVVQVECE